MRASSTEKIAHCGCCTYIMLCCGGLVCVYLLKKFYVHMYYVAILPIILASIKIIVVYWCDKHTDVCSIQKYTKSWDPPKFSCESSE